MLGFLSAVLGWIPIVGPIFDGIFSILNKYFDYRNVKTKVEGQVDIEAMRASADIIDITKEDIGVRLARDIIIFPVSIWTALISWDTIMAIPHPDLMWHTEKFPDNVAYLPLAVIGFLLGSVGLTIWRRYLL